MTIVKLEPLPNGGFRLCFEDGSSVKTAASVVAEFGLYSGVALSEEKADALMARVSEVRAKQRAANMIGRRAMSKKELMKKLKEKGESDENAETAAARLEELGAVNDLEYAKLLARRLSGKGYGLARLKNELYMKGIPREHWDEALEELEDPSEELDHFLRSRLEGPKPDKKELKKVTDALFRKGFAWEDIRSALIRYGEDVTED